MGSHILDILRQGIWASLTGGWFYDPHLSIFINTFHLYLWLFLLAFPLILHLTLTPTLLIWAVYCGIVGFVFVLVKVMNYKLHHMFDTSEMIEEVEVKTSVKGDSNPAVALCTEEPPETIEMKDLSSSASKNEASQDQKMDLPPDTHSERSRKQSSESNVRKRRSRRSDKIQKVSSQKSTSRAPLAEMDKDEIDLSLQGAVGGTSKTLSHHHGNSDEENEDTQSDADDDLSVPNTITTKADVEAEPSDCPISLPDDTLSPVELKSPSDSKHSCDADFSDVSPEHENVKMKKSRHKAQRAKSALESSELPSKHSSERSLRSRPSLPARPKLQSVINKDTGVSIIRPWSDQTICRTKQMLESDEITVIDFEVMNNVAKAYQTRSSASKQDRLKLNQPSNDTWSRREPRNIGTPWFRGMNPDIVSSSEIPSRENVQNLNNFRTRFSRSSHSVPEHKNEDEKGERDGNEEPCSNGIRSKSGSESNGKKKKSSTRGATRSDSSADKSNIIVPKTVENIRTKHRTRNAISEERYVETESSRTSSQPAIKARCSMFPSSSDEDSDLSAGEVVVIPQKEKKKKRASSDTTDRKSNLSKERTKVNKRTRLSKSDHRPRPNSAEFVQVKETSTVSDVSNKNKVKIHSSPALNTNGTNTPEKPKDIGFARVSKMLARAASDKSVGKSPSVTSVPNSQQSSVLGLDWLFSTDSDSSDTRSHHEHDGDSITSTSMSLDDSFYDNTVDQSVIYKALHDTDTLTSPSSTGTDDIYPDNKQEKSVCSENLISVDQSADFEDFDIKEEDLSESDLEDGEVFHCTLPVEKDKNDDKSTNTEAAAGSKVCGVTKPSSDELETMMKQGAIPKHFNKPLPPLPETVTKSPSKEDLPDTKASSPSSFDLSDPEEFHRKLIEILNEPAETSTEQLKKFMAVMEAKKNKSSSVKSKSEKEDKSVSAGESGLAGACALNPNDGDDKSTGSKPVTPTEISSLLPDNEESKTEHRLARQPARKRRHAMRQRSPTIPPCIANNSHIAESHEDTSEGATHLFQDEDGNWFSYTFGDGTAGVALSLAEAADGPKNWKEDRWSSSSCASGSMVVLDSLKDDDKPQLSSLRILDHHHDLGLPGSIDIRPTRGILQAYVDQLLENGRRFDSSSDTDSKEISDSHDTPQTKHFYKFKLIPKKFIKIYFDRLALLALLDRNLSVIENFIAVMMAMCVGALGALVLAGEFYYDIWMFLFCFIMAGCQYSLIKSVQPDAASPMHGYNHLIVFSRPFYFCVCCGLMLLLDYVGENEKPYTVYVYGMPFTTPAILLFARDFLKVFLLCLPVIFTVGLLPQVNTFITFTLEQIDTHLFGGNATVSLISSVCCLCRSLLAAGFLYVICYLTLIQLGKNIVDEPDPCKNPEFAQTAAFSIYCAVLVAISYHLSRSASDPSVLWMLIKDKVFGEKEEEELQNEEGDLKDPLPGKMKNCVSERLQSDLLISIVIMILSFAIHVSTVFIQPLIDDILYFTVAGFGFLIHYLIPQLRKEMPWLCCSHPLLKSQERSMFEATGPAKIMWFEKLYIWMRFVERNGMYPVIVLCALTRSVPDIICKFGNFFGPLVLTVCSLKLLRFAFSNTPKQHMILAFTVLFFKYDVRWATETTLIDYFFIAILFTKFCDLYLKMKFIITYIAPWQITWGSAFHAFAQPFSVPHSAMLFLQAGVSSFFSTPLNPFLGSAIFITSYVRPVKFWEKDYNTKRVDHSNTRLSQQLERNTGADDNNLNSIFYEHLTRSLQHSLCGDLLMGRWGNAEQGDIFIMASDSLNALVHIIEMGNGLVTFQLRGLEFRGTYCQQREVEAITESVEDNDGFCCFEPGHLPHFLSLNAAFNQRWLSWEVVVTKYVLEGYSISDNNAASMVGVFDFRKVLIMYYVQSIIYYTVRSPRLEQWLENSTIQEALATISDENYCDVDPTFSIHVDDDYDSQNSGISRKSFCNRNLDWIQYCASRREKQVDCRRDSALVSLCFALSLLGRRALGTASHNNASASVEFFLYGLHALFKGDFRITSSRDEWVFADMELLRRVVAPGVRMSLKLHQDHFLISEAYENEESLYDAISQYETNLVISHEADPAWRNAVLSNTPSLLALRNVFDEGSDEYKIIMLNKRYLTFRIVKVNRECVRGLWAGQQQELIFLRNRNPERGSIQNAKQALRNMINSSCDQPIGYPIYVSPLTTSYSSTNEQYTSVIGGEFIIANVKRFFKNAWQSLRRHCGASCTSGSSAYVEGEIPYSCTHQSAAAVLGSAGRGCPPTTPVNTGDLTLASRGNRGSLISTTSSAASKPRSVVTLGGLIGESPQQKEGWLKVKIYDITFVYDSINLGRRIDVQWPNEEWRSNGGKNGWAGWYPIYGMEGVIVHRWIPCHKEVMKRSHVDKTILLVQIGDKYVPIAEQGVQYIGAEVC